MSEAQKKAAVERLAKAREARKKDPTELKNVHPTVAALDSSHHLSYENCKKYLKACKEQIKDARAGIRRKEKGAESKYYRWKGYESNINTYIRNGDWLDDFYGEEHNKKIKWRCIAMAYHDTGKPKRTIGMFYSDCGEVWTQEMEDDELEAYDMKKREPSTPVSQTKRRRKTNAK